MRIKRTYSSCTAGLSDSGFVKLVCGSLRPFCGFLALLFVLHEVGDGNVAEVEVVAREGCLEQLQDKYEAHFSVCVDDCYELLVSSRNISGKKEDSRAYASYKVVCLLGSFGMSDDVVACEKTSRLRQQG